MAGRPGRARGVGPDQTYDGTMSVYGAKRADSVGYNPANPQAYTATKAAKAYSKKVNNDPSELIQKEK